MLKEPALLRKWKACNASSDGAGQSGLDDAIGEIAVARWNLSHVRCPNAVFDPDTRAALPLPRQGLSPLAHDRRYAAASTFPTNRCTVSSVSHSAFAMKRKLTRAA